MNKIKLIQYLLLIFLGIAMNYHFIPIGDYCRGLLGALYLFFFGSLFLIVFAIIISINLYKKIKNKKKFDIIPMLIFVFFGLMLFGLLKLNYHKFWTQKVLVGVISYQDKPNSGILKLYANSTFDVTLSTADYSCTYVGIYEFRQDTILLLREDLENETDKLFTSRYIISEAEKILKPLDEEFSEIEILEDE